MYCHGSRSPYWSKMKSPPHKMHTNRKQINCKLSWFKCLQSQPIHCTFSLKAAECSLAEEGRRREEAVLDLRLTCLLGGCAETRSAGYVPLPLSRRTTWECVALLRARAGSIVNVCSLALNVAWQCSPNWDLHTLYSHRLQTHIQWHTHIYIYTCSISKSI